MGKVIRLTEIDLLKLVKKIVNEQSAGSYSIEKIHEIPNKTVEEINKIIKANPMVRSGSRLVQDTPTMLVYSNTLRVDNPQLKNSQIPIMVGQCYRGTYNYDITFYIKEGKIKIIVDNFSPNNVQKIIAGGGGAPCHPILQNFGVVMKDAPSTSALSGRLNVWKYMIKIMNGNIPLYLDSVIKGFDQTQLTNDPYNF